MPRSPPPRVDRHWLPEGGGALGEDMTPFPAGLLLTREAFEAWFDTVYAIALRGAFRSKLAPACGVGIGRRGRNDIVASNPYAARREAKRDALSSAVELVYTGNGKKNPIIGRRYNSVRHLAHAFRKVADGHAHGRQRAERKAARLVPDPTTSGVNARTANAVPTTAEHDAPRVRFVPKYVAYEKVPCPACHRAEVPLTTRQCPDCGALVPHGARVQLRDDARERLWTRALGEVRRDLANGKQAPDEDFYPHESMLPHEIPAPWTAGLQAAYRAGATRRAPEGQQSESGDRRGPEQGRRCARGGG